MGGFATYSDSGTPKATVYADNVDFSGTRTNTVTTNGQLLIGSTAAPNIRVGTLGSSDGSITWTPGAGTLTGQVTGGTSVGKTITGNTGGALSPTAGNWNLPGNNDAANGFATWSTGTGSTLTLNSHGTVKWVVHPTAGIGTHQTIAAALTAASSGDVIFLTPGTYTENLTLKAGVNIVAHTVDSLTPNVSIVGKLTATYTGTSSISGVRLTTNSDNFLTSTGANVATLNLIDCYLNCSNATGILLNNANFSLFSSNCSGNIGTTGISLHTLTSCAGCSFYNLIMTNSGGSSTASSIAAGGLVFFSSVINHPISTSSAATVAAVGTTINTSGTNTTSITTAGTGISSALNCIFISGTASALSIGAGTEINATQCSVNSSNANAVTGAGTFRYGDITFYGSSATINTTTQVIYPHLNGTPNSTAPAAGFIGERITSSVLIGAPTTLTTATAKSIMSVSLTPGIWDVTLLMGFFGGTTVTDRQIGIGTTNDSMAGTVAGDSFMNPSIVGLTNNVYGSIPNFRVSLSATTIYYGLAQATFTVGTDTVWGRLSAVRVG